MTSNYSEFTETMTLVMPEGLGSRMPITESDNFGEHGLIVEVAAIHEGLTANFNHYSETELQSALESWVQPYPKPILINHDQETHPLGRVMAAKMDKEADGTPFTRLQIAVTDPEAMARVSDKRYLTGSVGGRSDEALCSVCGKDWAEASPFSLPCKHVRGKTYKGKLAYLERKNLSFKEYSFVNVPADSRSSIRNDSKNGATENEEAEDGWVRPARFFDLNMQKEEIVELAESNNIDLLAGMKRKEATPLYLQLKGAFLSALSIQESDSTSSKESFNVTKETDSSELTDVLEALENDLAVAASSDTDATDDEGTEEEGGEDTEATDTDAPDEEGDEAAATCADCGGKMMGGKCTKCGKTAESEDDAAEEPATESGEEEDATAETEDEEPAATEETYGKGLPRPQGQERPRVANNVSTRQTVSHTQKYERLGNTTDTGGLQRPGDKTRDSDDAELNVNEGTNESAELDSIAEFELRVQELEAHEQALLAENARLKAVLHRSLAERVVDTKITLRLTSVSERAAEIEDHLQRTAASLADTLRDLSKMSFESSRVDPTAIPTIDVTSTSVEDANTKTVLVIENEEDNLVEASENVFVDVLMGRRKM